MSLKLEQERINYAINRIDRLLNLNQDTPVSLSQVVKMLKQDHGLQLFRKAKKGKRQLGEKAPSAPVEAAALIEKALSAIAPPRKAPSTAVDQLKTGAPPKSLYLEIKTIDAFLRKKGGLQQLKDDLFGVAYDLAREIATIRAKRGMEYDISHFKTTIRGMDVSYPNRETTDPNEFKQQLFQAFMKLGLLETESERFCKDDPYISQKERGQKAKMQGAIDRPSLQQQAIPMVINPYSPYHGLLLYHMVGTGKTRTALSVLKQFRDTSIKMIWVTTIRAANSLPTSYDDFPSFHGSRNSPFVRSSSRASHAPKKIALFTYQEFMNAVGYGTDTNKYGANVFQAYGSQKDSARDMLRDTIIVVDEAHKLFEEKNGAGQGQWAIEKLAYDSYRKSFDPANPAESKACKWIFLSATPMPTIEIPTTERGNQKVKTAGGPQAAFRLLNMLIPYPERRLPIDIVATFKGKLSESAKNEIRQEFPNVDFGVLRSADYLQRAQGLVSYFYPDDENWNKIFADIEGEDELIKISLSDEDGDKYKRVVNKLNATCAPAIKSQNVGRIARCYLRRLHWFGNNLQPKRNEGRCRPTEGKICLPGNLTQCVSKDGCISDPTGEFNHLNVPRAATLVQTIKDLDAKDKKVHGKTFKHVIYTGAKHYTADMYASALVLGGGFRFMKPSERYKELGLKAEATEDEVLIKVVDRAKFNSNKSDDVLFYMHDNLTKTHFAKMQAGFNEKRERLNKNGDIARILVLGPGRKEALTLHDVKYIHIMEPQATETDTTQIIGRARRYCSHIGLKPKERKLKVLMYGLTLKEADLKLTTAEGGDNQLALLSYDALRMDPDIGKELAAREKILTWLQYGAYDIELSGKSPDQIMAAFQAADAYETTKAGKEVFFRKPQRKTSEIAQGVPAGTVKTTGPKAGTKNALIQECEETKGIKLTTKGKKTKQSVIDCCTPDQPPAGCVSTRGMKKAVSPLPPASVPALAPQGTSPVYQADDEQTDDAVPVADVVDVVAEAPVKQKLKPKAKAVGPKYVIVHEYDGGSKTLVGKYSSLKDFIKGVMGDYVQGLGTKWNLTAELEVENQFLPKEARGSYYIEGEITNPQFPSKDPVERVLQHIAEYRYNKLTKPQAVQAPPPQQAKPKPPKINQDELDRLARLCQQKSVFKNNEKLYSRILEACAKYDF